MYEFRLIFHWSLFLGVQSTYSSIGWGPVWLDQNQIWILKSGSWNHEVVNKQNVESESGFPKTNAKSGYSFYPDVAIYLFYMDDFFSKCHCVVTLTFYCEIVDCKLLKQIVWSFHWHLPIAVGHLESKESGSGAGFMVSRIRIRFRKIWPKQTQRILKPVSVLV